MTKPTAHGIDAFPERLAALLDQKNDGNQSEAARQVGVTPQAFNRWINGIATPRGKTLEKLAHYLGTTAAYLKYGDGSAVATAEYLLMWVEVREEATLLHQYRHATARGKTQLLTMAGRIEKEDDQNLPRHPGSGET